MNEPTTPTHGEEPRREAGLSPFSEFVHLSLFVEVHEDADLAAILHAFADRLSDGAMVPHVYPLHDVNGNRVGSATLIEAQP